MMLNAVWKLSSVLSLLFSIVFHLCDAKIVEINSNEVGHTLDEITGEHSLYPADEYVLFLYADWCRYCSLFKKEYKELDRMLSSPDTAETMIDKKVQLLQANVEKNHGLSSRFYLTYLPSLYHIKDGQVRSIDFKDKRITSIGNGKRDAATLFQYISAEKWKEFKEWSWVFNPFQPPAKILGLFGDLVGVLHNSIQSLSVSSEFWSKKIVWVSIGVSIVILGTAMWISSSRKPARSGRLASGKNRTKKD